MWRCLVCLFLVLLPGYSEPLSNRIEVDYQSDGCFHSEHFHHIWSRRGDRFLSKDSKRSLTGAQVQEIREHILAAKPGRASWPEELGITKESLSQHRSQILSTCKVASLTPELERFLDYSYVKKRAERITFADYVGDFTRISINFGGQPSLQVSCAGAQRPGMLPWKIKLGSKKWETVSLAVPSALARFPELAFLEARPYWTKGFWTDPRVWEELPQAIKDGQDREFFHSLDGAAQVEQLFRLREAIRGFVNLHGNSLFVELEAKQSSVVDAARWWCPLDKSGKPTSSGNAFLEYYARCAQAVARRPWLLEWKKAGPDRTIEFQATAGSGLGEAHPETFCTPPWQDAGLPDKPEFELLLRGDDRHYCTVLLSLKSDRSLVTSCMPNPTRLHWLDGISLSYHPLKPEFLVVEADGRHSRGWGHKFTPSLHTPTD